MSATDSESPALKPFVFDVTDIEGHTNEEMMSGLPDAEALYEVLGRDLLTRVLGADRPAVRVPRDRQAR